MQLPTNPKASVKDAAAPMFLRIGYSENQATKYAAPQIAASRLVSRFGFAPFGPQPNQPAIAPAINMNWRKPLA